MEELWNAVLNFHHKFNDGNPLPLESSITVWEEESGELLTAINEEIRQEVALELADTLYTLFGVAYAYGLTLEEVQDAAASVIAKNARKTKSNTHINPDTGKVTRND